MTFVVFDLHKRYITACALDASDTIIAETRQLSTSFEAVLAWLGALRGPVTVGVEATLIWEWLATRLAKAVHTVQVGSDRRSQARATFHPDCVRRASRPSRRNGHHETTRMSCPRVVRRQWSASNRALGAMGSGVLAEVPSYS